MSKNLDIGLRLREERNRLGFNQAEFAAFAGTTRKSLYGYEQGDRAPAADQLSAWADQGVDVLYVTTGERSGAPGLAPDEELLLESYRAMPTHERKALLARLLAGDSGSETSGFSISGSGHRVAGRDYSENSKKK